MLNVSYKPEKKVSKSKKEGTYKLFERGYIVLPTDSDFETINTNFVNVLNDKEREWSTVIQHKVYSVEDMARIMWHRFEDLPDDNNEGLCEKYQKQWTVEKLEKMINESLKKSNNTKITENLKQKFLSAMGVVFRQGNAFVDYNNIPDEYSIITTSNLKRDTVSASSLKKEKVIFWTSETENYLTPEEKEFFEEIKDTTNAYRQYEVRNKYQFKTPQSFVIADSDPEKEFIKKLIETDTSIKHWIKSNSMGFYGIEYSWKKGEHTQRGIFNPDFFIETTNRIIVVEIKNDEQINNPDLENIGKYKAAIEHFKFVNKKMNSIKKNNKKYKFTMLTPKSFEIFFKAVSSENINNIDRFISELDATITDIIS